MVPVCPFAKHPRNHATAVVSMPPIGPGDQSASTSSLMVVTGHIHSEIECRHGNSDGLWNQNER